MGPAGRKRIGIDIGLACSAKPTGVESYARSLLVGILQQVPSWAQVHLYAPPAASWTSDMAGSAILHRRPDVNTALKNPWLSFRSLVDRLDILYAFGHLLPCCCAARRIPTLHDTIYEDFPECYPPGVPERVRKEVSQAVGRAFAVAVNSHTTADSLRRHYGWRGPVLVTGGAARSIFQTPEQKIKPPTPYFLYVGRLDKRKNVLRIVQAYRQLILQGHRCELVLVGPEDSGSAELTEALLSGKVEDEKIVRPGYLSDEDLVKLYQEATAFVFPSLAEGFGLPLLEAMACGTPVITSNRSALKEVAQGAALLITPEDVSELNQAMLKLLQSEQEADRLRQLGLARARENTWFNCGRNFWSGLEALF